MTQYRVYQYNPVRAYILYIAHVQDLEMRGSVPPVKLAKLAAAGAGGNRMSNIERDVLRQLSSKAHVPLKPEIRNP